MHFVVTDAVNRERLDRHWRRAEAALAAGDRAGTRDALLDLLAIDPLQPLARLQLSTLHLRDGCLRDAVEMLPAHIPTTRWPVDVALRWSRQLTLLGESQRAIVMLRDIHRRLPNHARPWAECGHQLSHLGQQAEALGVLAQAAMLPGGDNLGLRYTLGTVHAFCGHDGEAALQFEWCIARQPGFARAHWALSKLSQADPIQRSHRIDRLRQLIAAGNDAAEIHSALFNELDAIDECDAAWSALMACCERRAREQPFDEAKDIALFAALSSWPSSTATAVCDTAEPPTSAPIFVTGLPRSGTTLLERMLGNHPEVGSAGELVDVSLQLRWLANHGSGEYIDDEVLRRASPAQMHVAGQRYLERTNWRHGSGTRLLDKMPANALLLPQIATMLPGAALVLVERDLRDAAFSNLKELFGRMYRYSHDPIATARHVLRHRQLMRNYRERLGERLVHVLYEDLVVDPTSVARAVFVRCGLSFDDHYADIGRNDMPSATASAVQVRAKLSTRYCGQWQRYARQLAPMLDVLARAD